MRVLHFYKTYYPDTVGGVEQVIYQICRGTAKLGVESAVLSLTRCHAGDEAIELDGHKVYRAKLNFEIASNSISVSAFSRFKELARQADVIHYHHPWPFGDLVHFATRHGKKSVVTYHSDIVRQRGLLKLYRPLQRRFLSTVDRIVATSPNYLETSDVLNQYRHKTDIIPIGIDRSSYPEVDMGSVTQWRTRLGDRFFLFVGMLRYYKGLDVLLEAARGTDYRVVIVGSGPLEADLKRRAEDMQNVHFLGAVSDDDKVALLTLCLAFVLPSHVRSEAFGVSLLEGAMFGKPLISCEIGTGTTYVNRHNETGLVVPPNDPIALRVAMGILFTNGRTASEMGERAKARYWRLFNAERMVESYARMYTRIVKVG